MKKGVWFGAWRVCALWCAAWGGASCQEEIVGPSPALQDPKPDDPLPVEPAWICQTQHPDEGTALTLRGERLSPLPYGLPDDPKLLLPGVSLLRGAAADGQTTDELHVRYDGAQGGDNASALSWERQSQMTLRVRDELDLGQGERGPLPLGLYDVVVTNPNHKQARSKRALGVLDRPRLEGVTPGIVCLDQGPRTVELGGATVAQIAGQPATALVEGQPFTFDELLSCTDLAHPAVPAQSCEGARLTLAQGSVEVGFPQVQVQNPAPAGCVSLHDEDQVHLRVVPAPTLDGASPPLNCTSDGPRAVTLRGTGILTIDGALPAVVMRMSGGQEVALEVSVPEQTEAGAPNCAPVETQGHEVKLCAEVVVTLPQEEYTEVYRPTLTLTNPAPAGCLGSSSTLLTLVPDPTLERVLPPLSCVAQEEQTITVEGAGFLGIDEGAGERVPAVTLDGESFEVVGLDGCEPVEVAGGWTVRRCASASLRVPAGSVEVEPGGFVQPVVALTNPEPAPCSVQREMMWVVVPPPVIEAAEPSLVCNAQGDRELVLRGSGFLEVDGEGPRLTVGGDEARLEGLEDCADLPVVGLAVRQCRAARVSLPQGAGGLGDVELVAVNPAPAGCEGANPTALVLVPPPTLLEAAPPLACVAEQERRVTLRGEGFLQVDGALPSVTMDGAALSVVGIGGACEPVRVEGLTVQRCAELEVVVPQDMAQAEVRAPVLVVTNPAPAGCEGSNPVALVLAPPPVIDAARPALLCAADGERTLEIQGEGFLWVDGVPPEVRVDGAPLDPARLSQPDVGCEPLPVAGLDVQRCEGVVALLPQGSLGEGRPTIEVQNPAPAGCGELASGLLTVTEGPRLEAAEPSLVCAQDGAREVLLRGAGFLEVDGALPVVEVGGVAVEVVGADACAPLEATGLTVRRCEALRVTLPQGFAPEGDVAVAVTNPSPDGCTASDAQVLTIPPALRLELAEPSAVCQGESGVLELVVRGAGFLRVGQERFVVTVDGAPVEPTRVEGCSALDVAGLEVEACDAFVVELDVSSRPVGEVVFEVSNPAPSGCGVQRAAFEVTPPPQISAVEPDVLCSDVGSTVTILGSSFAQGAEVTVGGRAPDEVEVAPDGTSIRALFAAGLPAGAYDVLVRNAQGCEDTLEGGLAVEPTPLVFFVDPPVVYNGVGIEATIFTTGLDAEAERVELVGEGGARVLLEDFESPARPDRILATLPAGLAPGLYEVSVTSRYLCESSLRGRLLVTDQLSLALGEVEPAFVSQTQATAVTLRTAQPTGPLGFVSTPRAYLTPSADAQGRAKGLRAVVWKDASQVSAVVPEGLSPGSYDLIVVNPDGAVGLRQGAVTVTDQDPPQVSSVAPGSINSAPAQRVAIFGANLGDDARVTLECVDFTTGAPVSGGAVLVNAASDAQVDATVDAAGIPAGSVCVVVLSRGDGAIAKHSALSVRAPSQNLNEWAAGSPMREPRRGLGLLAGRPTNASRFLYAVGGDAGDPAQPKASVESVSVDPFGQMGAWEPQRRSLSDAWIDGQTQAAPRAFAGTSRVGSFVYVLGGHDGLGATDTALRAQILDPLAGPEVADLDARLDEQGQGLGAGLWFYRVAAVFGPDDPSNPGGESLPGEVLNVQLPAAPSGISLQLQWAATPGAVGYRVYRSPEADAPLDRIALLAEVTEASFEDVGGACDPAQTPLPEGSLGVWHLAGRLTTPREALASVAVADPADPSRWFLYAIGGRNASGALASGEVAVITPAPNGGQTMGPWAPLSAPLGVGRAELVALPVTQADTTVIPAGATYLYVGPGRGAANNVNRMEAGLVGPQGDIAEWASQDTPNPARVGAGGLAANGFLFLMGGSNRNASNGNDTSGEVVSPAPTVGSWDALGGGGMLTPRIYQGAAQESAFFFLAGGATSGTSGGVTETVEQTIQ